MGLGILEDTKLQHVPGTVLLNDEAAHAEEVTQGLKHGVGRNAHIVLSPQPTEDPNDPLNWSKWKREFVFITISLGATIGAGVNGPLINASFYEISLILNVPISAIVLVSGYNVLVAGISGPFVAALSRKYGKRPVFLGSTLLCIIGTAIGEAEISYNYLLAARVIQGFAVPAYEALIVSLIGDLFFVHQRAARVAFVNFIVIGASCLASIIAGQVFQSLGWKWLFHLYQIFLVAQFVPMLLFCPETTYIRDIRYETDIAQEEKLSELAVIEQNSSKQAEASVVNVISETPGAVLSTIPKKTFVQELAIYTGSYSRDNVVKYIIGPFLTLLNPAAFFALITAGLINSWYVGSSIIVSQVFAGSPWNYSTAQIGYLGTGPFIGGLLASLFVALVSERIEKWLTKLNKGIYEPEFKLTFMSLGGVFGGTGLFLLGWAMSTGQNGILCAFFHGLMMFGIMIGMFSTLSYGLDAFRAESSEIFIMNMLFKNFMFYGLSNFASDWVASRGPQEPMYVFGGTIFAFSLISIPVYIFGKRLRSWWSRYNMFVKLKLEFQGPKLDLA